MQSLIDSKLIAYKSGSTDRKRAEADLSANFDFVHILLHILNDDKAREKAELQLKKKDLKIANMSALQIAGKLVGKYLKEKKFLRERGAK